MKTIILNGSPRKNWNTAMTLREARKAPDYSRCDTAGFDEAHKREAREKQFPQDLKAAFRLGARLSGGK